MKDPQTPEELLVQMSDIEYGYIDRAEKKYFDVDAQFDKEYFLQSADEIERSRIGVCWDQVEYERSFFKKFGLPFETYFIVYYTEAECPSHTFLIFKRDGKYFWFEHSWGQYQGIHAYDSKEQLLTDVRQKFLDSRELTKINPKNLCLNVYKEPKSHLGCVDFYHYQEASRRDDEN